MSPVSRAPIRIGFVLHVMQVAGAEVLVAEIIRRLGNQIEPTVLCLDGIGQLGAVMQREGVPVIELHRRPGIDLRVAHRLAQEISRRKLEIIHAHQYTPFFYAALARCTTRHPFHLMFTEHGRHFPDVVSARRRLSNRALLSRFADEINAVCAFSATSLARVDGFGHRTIEVIPNGIDVAKYGGRTTKRTAQALALGLDPARRYVACIARFHPIKDHDMLIRAFADVAAAHPDVDLLLAGDGTLRKTLEQQCRDLGLTERVRFLGVRSDVPALLRAVDVFALTSISEAASITLLEAMASQLPVVVTDVGGNSEIVDEGIHGFRVARGDARGAAKALNRILSDRELAARLGAAGRRRVQEQFVLDRTVTTYFERYAAAAWRMRGRSSTAGLTES